MRPLNLHNVQAIHEGDFKTLPAGAYACNITEVTDSPEKEYLNVLFDIAVGEQTGYFSDDFYKDKPWAHGMILSYKEKALGMFKGRLEAISDSNSGFDAVAAIEGGNEKMLENRAVGVVFREEEYFNKKEGEFKMGSARPYRFCSTRDIQDGKYKEPKPKMLSDSEKVDALERAGIQNPKVWLLEHDGDNVGASTYAGADPYDDVPFL